VTYRRPRKLTKEDELTGFNCGHEELDTWLTKYALVSHLSGMARVFVTQQEERIAGFYALATGGVEHANAPRRITTGIPRHPVPVTVLTRMAVGLGDQGRGLGKDLLRDALIRVNNAADEVGIRALLIHAKDEAARDFYMHFAEFEPSPTDPLHLFLLMKDLRKTI
jgi:GNAT superfamily N-acetyltransferase